MIAITLDNPWDYKNIITMLKTLKKRIHVRVVFDLGVDLREYEIPIKEISKYAFIMGQVCDSFFVKDLSINDYYNRCYQLYNLYDSYVAIWEIGNEVNGDWLGPNLKEKLDKAKKLFSSKQKAITLYADENETYYRFIEENKELLSEMQYIFISEYPQDNSGHFVDLKKYSKVMSQFNAYWGFGECGTKVKKDKLSYFNYYYKVVPKAYLKSPNFVGGNFWWFQKDFVKNGPLLVELQLL